MSTMNKSEWAAIFAFLSYLLASVGGYIMNKTLPDFTVAVPLVLAIYSAFHASGSVPSPGTAAAVADASK